MADDLSSEYVQQIEDCKKRGAKMTYWETNFIDSLSKQIADGKAPSQKRVDILDRIWEKVTKHG